ncbi:MAG: YwiC-like family protein, partial [Actinomycetota bacterium]|nr:YwiC-like family protein [Actinomycetota bacterium]
LGLVIAPSVGGAALGVAAFLAFLVRTPLKLAIVDARRGRWLERSRLALRIAIGELIGLAALVAVAVGTSGWSWLVPVAAAAPLVGVELWFDVRSRGRRLVPELCGSIGIASVAAVIVLAAGRSTALAGGVWLVLAARSVGAVPFVRVQIARLRHGVANTRTSDVVQAVAVALGAVAVVADRRMAGGLAGVVVLAGLQVAWVRRPPIAAKRLGLRQMMLGVGLVAVTAVGVLTL